MALCELISKSPGPGAPDKRSVIRGLLRFGEIPDQVRDDSVKRGMTGLARDVTPDKRSVIRGLLQFGEIPDQVRDDRPEIPRQARDDSVKGGMTGLASRLSPL